MMRTAKFMLLFMLAPLNAAATDFATVETVRMVLNCMVDNGGLSDENLYTCSCRHDAIADRMPFSDYEEGVTYERNKAMPGEKGGFFRDNKRGEQFYKTLLDVRKAADGQCITVRKVERRPNSE